MKKIAVLLVLAPHIMYACIGFDFFSSVINRINLWAQGYPTGEYDASEQEFGESRPNKDTEEMNHAEITREKQELEILLRHDLQKVANAYQKNEITEIQFKNAVITMYVDCMFLFPPDKLAQLFPGLKITRA